MYERREIPGLDGYWADTNGFIWSQKGRGRSLINPNEKLKKMKSSPKRNGYLYVQIYNNGKSEKITVHRLILKTFISLCPPGMETCHNDGTRTNNNIENLRWDTRSSNQLDAVRHGTAPCLRVGENHSAAKLKETQVRVIRALKGKMSQREISSFFGVCQKTISHIYTNKSWAR